MLAGTALIAGAAWACVPQASLSASPATGGVGSTITLTGGTYDAAGGPVSIWWDTVGGTPIATTTAGTSAGIRNISVQITVPANATSGSHIVFATQNDANGVAIPGSPVRAVFRVTDGAAPAPVAVNPQGSAQDSEGAAGLAAAPVETPAPATSPAAAASATPVRTPARVTTPAPVAAVVAPAPAPVAATPAPATVETPAPVAPVVVAPAPAVEATPAPAVEPAPATQATSQDSGTSGWVLAGLAILAFGLFAVGTGIFLTERRKAQARG